MGGSFAKALKKYNLAKKVYGYDHNISHQKEAISLGFVDEIVELDKLKNESDLVVLAIPVDGIIKFLPSLEGIDKNTTITDFGSTKKFIVDNIPNSLKSQYVPAHPMTGTEKSGPSASIDGLYEDKIVVLCDIDRVEAIHKVRIDLIFNTIKMNIVYMDSSEHDIHAGYISHLPHAISFALANTVMSHENPENIVALAAGGFRDTSRIAKSSPHMWTDIFRQNRDNLLDGIRLYKEQLSMIEKTLEDGNYEEMKKLMEKANTLHNIL
jgi:prephenate dehydrogenase